MIENQTNETRFLAGYLCLADYSTLTTLALNLVPAEWINNCLIGAVLLGLSSAGLTASAVSHGA